MAPTDYLQDQFHFHDNKAKFVKKNIENLQTLDRRFYVADFTTRARLKAMLLNRLNVTKTQKKHERIRKDPCESSKLEMIEGSLKDC